MKRYSHIIDILILLTNDAHLCNWAPVNIYKVSLLSQLLYCIKKLHKMSYFNNHLVTHFAVNTL